MMTRINCLLPGVVLRQCRSYSFSSRCLKKVSFSETGAYYGADKAVSRAANLNKPLYIPNRYDTQAFRNKRFIYAIISVFALTVYFGCLREPSDIDLLFETPPHLLVPNVQRRRLRDQINQARTSGQKTELLEAELAYLDVKEAAIEAQYKSKHPEQIKNKQEIKS